MCIFWNMPRETMCIKLCMLCLTSYLYFSEHPRTIQINCEEFTWHCAISSNWNVNCINLFCSALVERIFVLFYQFFALREENQTRFKLSSEVFDEIETFSPTVSPFVACKKGIIYAWIMNCWIVYREIGQPIYFLSFQEISKLKMLNWLFINNQTIRRMSSGNLKLKSLVLPCISCILTSWNEATWDIVIIINIILIKYYVFLWRVLPGRICCFCSQAKVTYNFLLEITKIMTGNDKQYTKVSNMKNLGRSFIPPAN